MHYTVDQLIILFFFYSFVGWAWETIYCSIKAKKFQYRGFLYGPYCPVYGFAVTVVLLATQDSGRNWLALFFIGFVVATVFEYVASVFLEVVFHMKLWDYSKLWGNFQGRVAPAISLFWGIAVDVLILYIQPPVMRLVEWIHVNSGGIAASIIVAIMGTDTVITVIHVRQFQEHARELEEHIDEQRKKLAEEAETDFIREHPGSVAKLEQLNSFHEEVDARVDQWRDRVVSELRQRKIKTPNWHERWMMRNYPGLRFTKAPRIHAIREELMNKHPNNPTNSNHSVEE